MASKTKVTVTFKIDMVKISKNESQGFSTVLWRPFDDDTALARAAFIGTLAEIEAEVARLAEKFTPAATVRCVATGDKFNGFQITTGLHKNQRKPNGWNASRKLKIEKEVT